jgi:hypothetical protein
LVSKEFAESWGRLLVDRTYSLLYCEWDN